MAGGRGKSCYTCFRTLEAGVEGDKQTAEHPIGIAEDDTKLIIGVETDDDIFYSINTSSTSQFKAETHEELSKGTDLSI